MYVWLAKFVELDVVQQCKLTTSVTSGHQLNIPHVSCRHSQLIVCNLIRASLYSATYPARDEPGHPPCKGYLELSSTGRVSTVQLLIIRTRYIYTPLSKTGPWHSMEQLRQINQVSYYNKLRSSRTLRKSWQLHQTPTQLGAASKSSVSSPVSWRFPAWLPGLLPPKCLVPLEVDH